MRHSFLIGDETHSVELVFVPEEELEVRAGFYLNGDLVSQFAVPLRDLLRGLGLHSPQLLREIAVRDRRSPFEPADVPLVPHPEDLFEKLKEQAEQSQTRHEAFARGMDVLRDMLTEMGYGQSMDLLEHPEKHVDIQ